MIQYNYTIKQSDIEEEIKLNDFYISSNLSCISGTVEGNMAIKIDDNVFTKTPYFPKPQKVNLESTDTVKRNGYLTHILNVPIKSKVVKQYNGNNSLETKDVRYIEYHGNIYYQLFHGDAFLQFEIEGQTYIALYNDDYLPIIEKCYIEDNQVNVDGVVYGVNIAQDPLMTTFTDSIGEPYIPNNKTWDLSHITTNYEFVQKVIIKNKANYALATTNIGRFGYRPYIVYNNEMYTLEIGHKTLETGEIVPIWGVNVGGVFYEYDLELDITDTQEYTSKFWSLDLYGAECYSTGYDTPVITIGDTDCEVFLPKTFTPDGKQLCIETTEEHPSVMVGDILKLETNNSNPVISVRTDNDGDDYVFYNGVRYNKMHNLCDSVNYNGTKYPLTYEGSGKKYYKGQKAYIKYYDGTIIYFQVANVKDGYAKTLNRIVKTKEGRWIVARTVREVDGEIKYAACDEYSVYHRDGFLIDGERIPIKLIEGENFINNQQYDKVINYHHSLSFRVKVVDYIGSNKLICEPEIESRHYTLSDYNDLYDNTLNAIVSNNCIVEKKPNCFGRLDLTFERWVSQALNSDNAESVYSLSNIQDNIHLFRLKHYYNLPVNLERPVNNDMSREDLIMSQYYSDKAEESINRIVDMDKDIYSPVYRTRDNWTKPTQIGEIEKIQFNLHFRTRDMDNWTIYEDEATYFDGDREVLQDIHHLYSNWFCTDYYPYNCLTSNTSSNYINTIMNTSDLLGFLYFTTDDVKRKANKLTRSFLRLTYYDSPNPDKQNMLGTSTVYFNVDRYFNTLYHRNTGLTYVETAKNRSEQQDSGATSGASFTINDNLAPSVTREAFKRPAKGTGFWDLHGRVTDFSGRTCIDRLDSRIEVTDRLNNTCSSEGFYLYILKEFADRNKTQTIYMKAEFFHAGLGIKIPMVLATDASYNAIGTWTHGHAPVSWTWDRLRTFKDGYDISDLYKRIYIPIEIYFDKTLNKFVYKLPEQNYYDTSTRDYDNDKTTLVFNLFELKIKP